VVTVAVGDKHCSQGLVGNDRFDPCGELFTLLRREWGIDEKSIFLPVDQCGCYVRPCLWYAEGERFRRGERDHGSDIGICAESGRHLAKQAGQSVYTD